MIQSGGHLLLVVMVTGVLASPVISQEQHVKNGSFEVDSDGNGIPDEWSGHNLGSDDQRVPGGVEGSFSFRIVGERGVNKALRQSIRVRIPAGTRVVFGAASRAEGDFRSGGLYASRAKLIFADDTTLEEKAGFKNGTGGWRIEERLIVLPKNLRSLVISVVYNDHEGIAWFDRVRLWTP